MHRVASECLRTVAGWNLLLLLRRSSSLGKRQEPLRTVCPLASEVATYPLPVAAVARVAPPAAGVAAFVQEYPATAHPGAELDPTQLRGSQELRRRLRHGPQGAVQPRISVIPAPVPAPSVCAISGHHTQVRERDRELAVERPEVALVLGFTGDGPGDHSVYHFSESKRSRKRLPRPLRIQHRPPKEPLRLLQTEQTSLSAPVKQVLIGAEVLAGVVSETPTHGIDEVQGHVAAPELESPLSSCAAHIRLPVSNRLCIWSNEYNTG